MQMWKPVLWYFEILFYPLVLIEAPKRETMLTVPTMTKKSGVIWLIIKLKIYGQYVIIIAMKQSTPAVVSKGAVVVIYTTARNLRPIS